MVTKYFNDIDFQKLKPIKLFPNENIIEAVINKKLFRIHKTCNITIKKPTKEECFYYGLKENSFILKSENGFFPCDLLFTTKEGRYFDGLNIGANTGVNLGTASIGVLDIKTAKDILIKNNFCLTN